MTAAPEVSQAEQLADAQQATNTSIELYVQARGATHAAHGAYTLARRDDPAGQGTDHAREGWRQAMLDEIDALVAAEKARDEFNAIERQARP